MFHRFTMFRDFVHAFWRNAAEVREVILALLGLILLGGTLVAWLEKIPYQDGIYFAFITALSIGYGDVTPSTNLGRIASVIIGFVGIFFMGINVAVATHALSDILAKRGAPGFRDNETNA